jgi:hypothetical protein
VRVVSREEGSALRRVIRHAATPLVGLAVAFYLAQQSLVAPNELDDGLCLEMVALVARGKRPFWDFFDAYGPLHYQGPALFYALAGGKVWGVRLWVLLEKLVTVALTFRLVRALAGQGAAWLALAMSTVLLGLPWQSLQAPYASLGCAPLLVAAYFLLTCRPLGSRASLLLAAGLTTATLFIKVSSGVFLLAGGVLHTLCIAGDARPGEAPSRSRSALAVQLVAITSITAAFLWFVRKKPDPRLFLFLDVPLVLAAAWTTCEVLRDRRSARPFGAQLRSATLFAGATAGTTVAAFLLYFGWSGGAAYLRELSTLLGHLHYVRPLRAFGDDGIYPAFNRFRWPELPWLVTGLFVAWWTLGVGRSAESTPLDDARRRAGGLWVMTALGGFVVYSLGTEIHSAGVAWVTVPAFAVLLGQLGESLRRRGALGRAVSVCGAILVLAWCATIAVVPRLGNLVPRDDFHVSARAGKTPHDNRLAFLRRRLPHPPDEAAPLFIVPGDVRDRQNDEAAMLVDELTSDGEEVLVLTRDQLITFASFTEQVGGRYRFLLYLARTGLLDRSGVEALAPGLVERLLASPPRVIVTEDGDVPPLLLAFPELRRLAPRFRPVRSFGTILVLLRRDVTVAPGALE